LKKFFTNNINAILGTISLHLMMVIVFLLIKLGEIGEVGKKQVLIAFNEEILPPEEKPDEKSLSEEAGEALPSLDYQTVHSIASNVASKMDEEISTEKYEQQVMQELGISSLKSEATTKSQNQTVDENAIEQTVEESKKESDLTVPNLLRKDNTTVSYFLENRWHKYIYIPTYKCQGGGTVILNIIINQSGKVISALISENKSTQDPCLLEEAYQSAVTAQFNSDPNASPRQLGTITYVFLAQ
jgi:hypothetical protein